MAIFDGKSLADIFHRQAKALHDRISVSYKNGDEYTGITWGEMQRMILSVAAFLKKSGIRKGDRVAIFSPNRYEWWVADLAILSIGAIDVPVYATNSAEEALFILKDSGAKCCFTGGDEHLEKILSIARKLPSLKTIISSEPAKRSKRVVLFQDIKDADEKSRASILSGAFKVTHRDVATIIYTSGTTGNPKGVVLTHGNIVRDLKNTFIDIGYFFNEDDVFLSFLPLSHVLERTAGFYAPMCIGARVAFAEDVSRLLNNMIEIRPTALISVPRIYEKIHAGILSKLKAASPLKKIIFAFAASTATANLPYVCLEKKRPLFMELRYRIANKLVFSKIMRSIGHDRLKCAISGGGPLSVTDAEFFIGMGIRILEGFGLTETSPITHYNRPGEIVIGGVGRAIPETDVRIEDDGEILIRGPQVMKEYFRNKKATKEVFTKDKFFKTGDIGRIDENGVLYITGRKKDIIVTSGGKNISPQNIENMLKSSHYIEQVALVGDRRKFISALIVPVFSELEKWAGRQGITYGNRDELLADSRVIDLFDREIERLTKSCSRVERVKRFALLAVEWSQDGGEMTPSQKIKRHVIEQKYSDVIDRIYRESQR